MDNKKIKLFITEDGSHSLQVPDMDETYHSSHGAVQESQHVFIKNGLMHWLHQNTKTSISIFEVGFGTGLNALLTILKSEELNIKVEYQTIELHPVPSNIISQLNYPEQLDCDPAMFRAIHDCKWEATEPISKHYTITKNNTSLIDFTADSKFDLIYFDAFAPSKQPEMWGYSILQKCFSLLNSNGIFVTYSANGQLKRDLKKAEFSVESVPGPPGKFEMVRAIKNIRH